MVGEEAAMARMDLLGLHEVDERQTGTSAGTHELVRFNEIVGLDPA